MTRRYRYLNVSATPTGSTQPRDDVRANGSLATGDDTASSTTASALLYSVVVQTGPDEIQTVHRPPVMQTGHLQVGDATVATEVVCTQSGAQYHVPTEQAVPGSNGVSVGGYYRSNTIRSSSSSHAEQHYAVPSQDATIITIRRGSDGVYETIDDGAHIAADVSTA